MIFIIAALQSEARPLIDHFGLKSSNNTKWRIYQSDEMALIVSNTGKVRSAMATTYLFNYTQFCETENAIAINVGICGSANPDLYAIGDLVVINQVFDRGNQRRYFPDMLLRHGFKESGLETSDRPATRTDTLSMPLVDMEAAGFFEASRVYFSPNRILCLKLVSDYLDGDRISPATVTDLVGSCIGEIEHLIYGFKKIQCDPPMS